LVSWLAVTPARNANVSALQEAGCLEREMTVDDYRRIALSLPAATESSHQNHPDFRVRGKVFATLWPERGHGVVMLTREEQDVLVRTEPGVFVPFAGGWGLRGATIVILDRADEKTVYSALRMAWRRRAPKGLALQ
jgi:hypothetical protein